MNSRVETRVLRVPATSVVAESIQIVDVPDNKRRAHDEKPVFIERRARQSADIVINDATPNSFTLPRLSESYGKALTPVYAVPMAERPIAHINVAELSPQARIKVQVQEAQGSYDSYDALTVYQAGQYEIDLSHVTGWTDARPFHIVIWIEGAGAEAQLDSFELQSASQPVKEVSFSRQVRAKPTAVQAIAVNPRDGWLVANTLLETHAEGCFFIAVENVDIGYGKAETHLINANLDQSSNVSFAVEEVDEDILYSVQLLEQFGDYRAFNIVTDARGTNQFDVDLRDIYPTDQLTGTKQFRFVVWVAGQGVIHVGELGVVSG